MAKARAAIIALLRKRKKRRFSAGFGLCFEKKTESFKSLLTESEAAHRSHSTDAVLFNEVAELVTKNQALRSPSQKEGSLRRRCFALFDIVI